MAIIKKIYEFVTPILWIFVLALVIFNVLGLIMHTDSPISVMTSTNSTSGYHKGDLLFIKGVYSCEEPIIKREDVYFSIPKVGYISLFFKGK